MKTHLSTTSAIVLACALLQTLAPRAWAKEGIAPEPASVAAPAPAPSSLASTSTSASAAGAPSVVPIYVVGGLATAGLVLGAVFGGEALHDKSEFDKNPTTPAADDAEKHALWSDMGFGVFVALGVTTLVMLMRRDAASTGSAIHPSIQAAAGGAKFALRF